MNNVDESIKKLKTFITCCRTDLEEECEDNFETAEAIETLISAYKEEKEKREKTENKITAKIEEKKNWLNTVTRVPDNYLNTRMFNEVEGAIEVLEEILHEDIGEVE